MESDGTMDALAISMRKKFDKYWKEASLNVILVIATVLDPRKKEEYLGFFFPMKVTANTLMTFEQVCTR